MWNSGTTDTLSNGSGEEYKRNNMNISGNFFFEKFQKSGENWPKKYDFF